MNKVELLEEAIDRVIYDESTLDADTGGMSEDEVCLWTVQKLQWKDGPVISIMLHYFTWHGNQWVDKSVSEMEGPALLNCPIRFFEQNITESTKFPEWRYEVKKYHESIGPEVQDQKVGKRLIKALKRKEQ